MSYRRTSAQTSANKSVSAAEAATPNILSSLGSGGVGTSITTIFATDSNYNPLTPPRSTVNTSGGYISIIGTNFTPSSQLYIQGTLVTSTTYVSSGQINARVPGYVATYPATAQIYVVNTATNSAGILITGFQYGIQPYWTIGTSLTGSTPSVSVNLSALSDTALTYALYSGTIPTGLSLNTSTGVLSGSISTGTSTTFTILATNVEGETNTQTFTITILSADPYFYETVLLLNGETNTSTWTTDASTNTFALTTNGTVASNRFSPLWGAGYYGVSFDGSTGYLTATGSSSPTGTGNFTIEAWINLGDVTANKTKIIYSGTTNNSLFFRVGQSYLGNVQGLNVGKAGVADCDYCAYNFLPNTWYHVAAVRYNSAIYFYVNGVQQTTVSGTGGSIASFSLVATSTADIGQGGAGVEFFNGYISNLRIANSAVYTTAFTPNTIPLTAIANTILLTCQSSNFVDNSTNAFTLTPSGTVKVVPNQPFNSLPTSITTINPGYYSSYFDGSTGYLTFPQSSNMSLGSNWTMECWVYLTNISGSSMAILSNLNNGSTAGGYIWAISGASSMYFTYYNTSGTGPSSTGSFTLATNTWYHLAVVGQGGTGTFYVNGVSQGGGAVPTSMTNSYTNWIGGNANSSYPFRFPGYISNLRVVNGTALYTSNFTPSTIPLTAVANTVLLTSLNSSLTDVSTSSFAISSSGKTYISTQQPFSSGVTTTSTVAVSNFGSGLFDGSSGYLTAPSNSAYALGSGAYTVEAWIYLTSASTTYGYGVMGTYPGSGASGWSLTVNRSSGGYGIYWITAGSASTTYGTLFSINTWYHVAIVRTSTASNGLTFYINGVAVATGTDSVNDTYSNTFYIGNQGAGSQYFPGYISNPRVVKGTAVYTSNFIPPTLPLTAVANTQLLTLQNKQSQNNNVYVDDSQNNISVSRTGTPTQGTFTPFSPTGWSNYFGFTNEDVIIFPSASQYAIGTGNFTVECWFNPSGTPTTSRIFLQGQSGTDGISLGYNAGTIYVIFQNSAILNYSPSFTMGVWYHLALVRNGSAVTLYVNGVSQATATSSTSLGQYQVCVGGLNWSTGYNVNGYISNLRYSNTAVYTTTFTPSTAPLTATYSTILLTCQSNKFIDNSTYNATPAITNSPQVQAFSPFAPGVPYNPAVNGGSSYHVSGNYIYGSATNLNISSATQQWQFECWLYPIDQCYFFVIGNGAAYGNGFDCGFINGQFTFSQGNGSNAGFASITSSGTFPYNAWYHFAMTKNSSGVITMWVNGTSQGTATNTSSAAANANTFVICGQYDNGGIGYSGISGGSYVSYFYISNARFIMGSPLYTTAFTPPTAPVTATNSTVLLLNFTNSGVQDQTGKNNIITSGSVKTQTSIAKYGSNTMYFDGSSSYLTSNASSNYQFGTGNFTVECWVNMASLTGYQTLLTFGYTPLTAYGWAIQSGNGNGNWVWYYLNSTPTTVAVITESGSTVNTNTWYHIAVVRNGTTLTMYRNGVSVGTASDTGNYTASATLGIGAGSGTGFNNYYLNGYIDDLRITKGVARYTANFTPPVSAFLTQ